MDRLTVAGNTPTMDWLRLTPLQTRVLLKAWSRDSIVFRGRELNTAHRLVNLNLLAFLRPIDGGLRGEFALTDIAHDYPPTGLRALVITPAGRKALEASNG